MHQNAIENFTLPDGSLLPSIGLGTYRLKGDEGIRTIREAIDLGYRFFDTASLYNTERELGQAIRQSGIPRKDFIIETKLWTDEMGYSACKTALARSLDRLEMDYVDFYLIHWPRPSLSPDIDWKALDIETWCALEEMTDAGKILKPGVSNFLPHHLSNLLNHCRIRPAVDQLELHPGHSQEAAVAFCRLNGILPIAWGPLGRGKVIPSYVTETLSRLGAKYGKSPQQICLRFLLDKGILPIPKASGAEHLQANINVFDFVLDREDLSLLSCMPQTAWLGEHPDFCIPQKKSLPGVH